VTFARSRFGLLLAPALLAGAAGAAVTVDAYEVYTELTVSLAKPAAFTCEPGGEPHTLVLTVAAEVPAAVAPAGRIAAVRVAPGKGATTFILTTAADAGPFRAYARKSPPAVVVDVFRRLDMKPPEVPSPFMTRFRGRKILLVDDDDGPGNGNKYSVDVDDRYRAAVTKLRVPFDVKVVRTGQNGPPASALAPYPVVIWFNGLDARPVVISAADEAAIRQYVADGGRLLLVSQNYLSDASRGQTPLARETLGIKSFKSDTQQSVVVPGAAAGLEEDRYDLGTDSAVIGNWGDGFKPPADAGVLFTGADDEWCYGMVRAAGAGRVAFYSFAVENVGYVGKMAYILAAALDALAAE